MSTSDPSGPVQQRIGSRIRVLRKRRGLRLEDLASRAGISYQYLSGVENGKENFSIAVLDAIAHALEVSLRSLIVSALSPRARAESKVQGAV
ncbi:MAG TPA: helix-turn-helix transcriptional regulator [Candidatus Binatia bacterium]|nr:helix-turn-helix transcriptional regulator [Candidatus Binatia bacterium]